MAPKSMPGADAVQPLSADEEAVVRCLPYLIYALPRAIDADMTRKKQISATQYRVLLHLSEAPNRLLHMGDLADVCEMSLSGTTRIVHRLEEQGLIERVRCDHDARGWHAALTATGLARLEGAWPANLAAVRRHFLDHLDSLDLGALAAALRHVAT